jgi:competence protein ComEC
MANINGVIIGIAYVLGLLATSIALGEWLALAVGIGLAFGVRRIWKRAPGRSLWIVAGMIAFLASFYLQLRTPQPGSQDISRALSSLSETLPITVQGEIDSSPRLTRSQKIQFWLRIQQATGLPTKLTKPTGSLYVTVPLLQGTGLHPGQTVKVTGTLYRPSAAANPGSFDFRNYLAQAGSFAGLRGDQVTPISSPKGFAWWRVQQRILQAQVRGLGSPEGQLVSAMVLGSKAVDLPYDLKDTFARVGLAHALAASGFQTSLILGVVLALTRRFSVRLQCAIGATALLAFVGLTGLQPAVLRATLMGMGTLVALLLERKIKPLAALLLTAVVLLLWNPLWIWDLGFQLSFAATIGLLVTVPPLSKALDWLPGAIVPLVAVPIAAYLWTLPLQLYSFGTLSPYSILVNVVTTPFVSLISLGGMISALAALVWLPAGSFLAWLLLYPTQIMIAIVQGCSQLPGNAYAVGTISALMAIALYSLLVLANSLHWWKQRWWLAATLALSIVLISAGQAHATDLQATVLATGSDPVLIVRRQGQTGLINSGSDATVRSSVLPFLQKMGINQIDWAIALQPSTKSQSGWPQLRSLLPKQRYHHPDLPILPTAKSAISQALGLGQPVNVGAIEITLLPPNGWGAQFTLGKHRWFWLDKLPTEPADLAQAINLLMPATVLWWSGKAVPTEMLNRIQPKIAIASGKTVNPDTAYRLRQLKTQLYWTGQDGAIQWTAAGIKTSTEPSESARTSL